MKFLAGTLALSMIVGISFFSLHASAKIVEQVVEYKEGETLLEGFLVYDDSWKDRKPGVLVVHEWMGLDDYTKQRARDLAQEGYVAFAADIYGKGVRPKNTKEAGDLAALYRNGDRKVLRSRILAALRTFKEQKQAEPKKIFAIGYCFGGTTVLELARTGNDILGVVSFHGGLSSAQPKDASKIKTQILVLHGAVDPYVSSDEYNGFIKEMEEAKADYRVITYAGAVHGFSNPKAGSDVKSGYAYNKKADERSWKAMLAFFQESLK